MPADFYTDTAALVQEIVGGGGVDIDVDDIKEVVADDECDTNTSRIDNAHVISVETESSERDEIRIAENLSDSTSNIDEAKVMPKEEYLRTYLRVNVNMLLAATFNVNSLSNVK